MNAKDARIVAEENLLKNQQTVITGIDLEIKTRATQGYCAARYNSDLKIDAPQITAILEYFQQRGYTVTHDWLYGTNPITRFFNITW